jgi:hypothetical protein
MGMKQPAQHYL